MRLAAVGALLAALATVLLAHALGHPYNHDEEQYVAAAALTPPLLPYVDYLYLQTPLYPLLQGSVFALAGGGDVYLTARLTTWMFSLAALALLFALARRLADSAWIAAGCVTLFCFSFIMAKAFGTARNDIQAIAFGLLGVWLLLGGGPGWRWFVAGAALAAAVGIKASAVFVGLGCLGYALARPELRRAVAPLCLGGLLGALPVAVLAAMAPGTFLYGNAEYHLTAPQQWFAATGRPELLTLRFQVTHTAQLLVEDTAVLVPALLLLAAAAWALARRESVALLRVLAGNHGLLMLVLLLLGLPLALLPRPPWLQYFQPLVPYLLLSVAALYPYARARLPRLRLAPPLVVVLVGMTGLAPTVGQRLARLGEPPRWTPSTMAATADALDAALPAGPVAGLSPIPLLVAGRDVPPTFATGPFFFRTAGALPAERVRRLNGLSPATLEDLAPPAAIVHGWEPTAEAPLVAWARARGYVDAAFERDGLRILLAPR